jgi:hypothetical protein
MKKKPLWRRILRWVVYIGIGLFVVLFLAHSIWNYIASRQLRQEIAKIRQAGEPLTFKEMDADLPKVDAADDAGRYYAAGLALINKAQSDEMSDTLSAYHEAAESSPTSRPAEGIVQTTEQLLKDNKLALEMFDRGAACAFCYFDMDVDRGMTAQFEHLSRLRSVARLLSLRARHQLSNGDAEGAVDSVICALRAPRVCNRRPVLVVYLVKVACIALVCEDIQTILEIGSVGDESLIRLEQELSVAFGPNDILRVVFAERISGLMMNRNVIGEVEPKLLDVDPSTPGIVLPTNYEEKPFFRHLVVGYLRGMSLFIDDLRKGLPHYFDKLEAESEENPYRSMWKWGWFSVLFPGTQRSIVLYGRSLAGSRSARTAIMIERYRLAHGKLPASLDDLVPTYIQSLPLDPFTGQALLYKHDETGYVVYSVSDNRQDDGGQLKYDKKNCSQPDCGIRVRRFAK